MQQQLQIIPIPAFKDNYIWLVHNGNHAIIVDPGDAEPVIACLKKLNLTLSTILITHHHSDHIAGVAALIAAYSDITIYAPKLEQYAFPHAAVAEPDTIVLSDFNLELNVLDLPGHTLGHIAYYARKNSGKLDAPNALFCGDTLFGAGCGRLFEGTPAQMYASLQKLAQLPPETQVYCTHEYTLHNINFALRLEPNNRVLLARKKTTLALRQQQQASLPSSIALELASNPFLRCHSAEIQATLGLINAPELQVFTLIREMRNHY
jgi:hydroxyacylglutathione hydrolase